MASVLPKGSILKFATYLAPNTKFELTEENRSEVTVDIERIEDGDRMANGRMRKWFVADKHTWSVSWDMTAHSSVHTVDGKWGGSDMENFYLNNPGEFYLYVRKPDGTDEQFLVTFEDFSRRIQKRGVYEFWSISMTLEEV